MKFLDQAKIFIQSGNGGAGAVSFRREKFIEFGGPDGGNGGKGGDVIFEVVDNLNTLIDFRYQQHFKAKTGMHGTGRNKSGSAGDNMHIKIPVGTQILDDLKQNVLFDGLTPGETFTLLKGGDGGCGNAHYKSSTNQAPRKSTPGWPGQEMWVWLRLKLIADVGLVGMPNAGKSTFLSIVSHAKPKIADYPFTTLVPNLGVAKAGETEFVIADIPGLIEGAHEGKGLGTRFLGHVERTKVLIHLIDMGQEDFLESYQTIRNELKAYDHDLAQKKEIIALNKCDLLQEDEIEDKLKLLKKKTKSEIHVISCAQTKNINKLLYSVKTLLD